MRLIVPVLLLCGALPDAHLNAQEDDSSLLVHDEYFVEGFDNADPSPDLHRYDRMNRLLGGEERRQCNGRPCEGWVEDHYPDGTLKHRGHYTEGQLAIYRNFYPDGRLERHFRALDNVRSVMRTYHVNGVPRSEVKYYRGRSLRYRDHYTNGQLRYAEQRHPKEPYFLRMDLYAADGKPISLLKLVDRRQVIFEQNEYHPDGSLKSRGRARYDRARADIRKVGIWQHFSSAGELLREEEYVDGKVHAVR